MITNEEYSYFKKSHSEILQQIEKIIDEEGKHVTTGIGIKKNLHKIPSSSKVNDYTNKIIKRFKSCKKEIRAQLCDKYAFCERINSLNNKTDEINFYSNLVDVLASFFAGFPLPIALVASYLLKKGYFHSLCNCEQE